MADQQAKLQIARWRISYRVLGIVALFSGAALLTNILAGVSLGLALGVAALLLAVAGWLVWRRASPAARVLLARTAGNGVLAGLLATITYDSTKFVLSQLDPSPYNPYEVIWVFGTLFLGSAAPQAAIIAAGAMFHLLNGVAFGVAFCFIFGKRGILWGVLWGLFLEMFQLTLYPGWLNIKFYAEFVQISALSHVAYGLVLGFVGGRRAIDSRR